jgi:hypothetical protein
MLAGLGAALLLMLAGLDGAVFAYASRPWCSFLLLLAGYGVVLMLMLAGLGGAVFAHASPPWWSCACSC